MKKFIISLLILSASFLHVHAQITCDICVTSTLPPIEEMKSGDVNTSSLIQCGTNLSICVNQNYSFSTTAVAGAIYAWSVVGNAQIIGPRDQNTVTVVASQTGTSQICLVKSVNGQVSCCICKTVTVTNCGPGGGFPFCPLKIVIDGTMDDVGYWDENCACVWNRVKFNVVCSDGGITTLNNWMSQNGGSGTIKWEITNGNFLFSTPLGPCGSTACSNGNVSCDTRPLAHPTWFVSGYICQCANLPYWNNMVVKATINMTQGGNNYNIVLQQQIHFNYISNGCGFKSSVSDLKVSPNPSNGNVAVQFNLAENENVGIALADLNGQVVKTLAAEQFYSKGIIRKEFLLNTLLPSMYSIVITSKGQVIQSEKLIIKK